MFTLFYLFFKYSDFHHGIMLFIYNIYIISKLNIPHNKSNIASTLSGYKASIYFYI